MAINPFDPRLFRPEAISAETRAFNANLAAQMKGRPKPWETQADGAGPSRMFAAPQSPRAKTIVAEVKGRRPVELHVVAPDNPKGVYMHIHGGGLIMGSATDQDPMLERIMNATGLACASVEYGMSRVYWSNFPDAKRARGTTRTLCNSCTTADLPMPE